MKQQLICLAVALGMLVGCGDGGGSSDPKCQTGACGAQRFCAHTPDGGVCWKDTTPPVIAVSSMDCSTTPCRRDSVLTVTATVSDESYGNAMGEVKVALDLDAEHPLTLQRVSPTGNDYRLEAKLADLPFPYFAHDVAATVSAKDEAGNEVSVPLAAVGVTRERWRLGLTGGAGTFPLSMPVVVKEDGRILATSGDGSLHSVSSNGAEQGAPVAIGAAANGPPALGAGAIWLAGQDGTLQKRSLTDGSVIALTDCTSTGGAALLGPPAVLGDRVIASSNGTDVLVARPSNSCNAASLSEAISAPASLDANGHVALASGTTLREFSVAASASLVDSWTGVTPPGVGSVVEPIAVDGEGALWTTALSGTLYRTTSTGASAQVSTAPSASSAGAVILSDNSAVVPDYVGVVRRLTATGSSPWTANPTVSGHPRTPLALGGSDPSLLVPTSDGSLYVLRQSTGELIWSTKLSPQALQPPNIWTEPGAKTSTAYLASANGTLYAVIVDGTLDTTAPWPKAYHDPQNTSNAATPF
jgi:outer membrane protein assembly factor BamB